MSRISKLYLVDIIESCERIRRYADNLSIIDFLGDELRIDGVVRNIEIIGEAVKNLPDDLRETRPEIAWKKIARFRDIIAHHYFKVDYERVWDIVENKIGELETAAREMLAAAESSEEPS
jgi:uncharacterized protein with HEPN domain